MPPVAGAAVAAALTTLKGLGVQVTSERLHTNDAPAGTVVKTGRSPGEPLTAGQSVKVFEAAPTKSPPGSRVRDLDRRHRPVGLPDSGGWARPAPILRIERATSGRRDERAGPGHRARHGGHRHRAFRAERAGDRRRPPAVPG